MSESISNPQRSIPVLYTRGTHFEVGVDMGRTFSAMIKEFLQVHPALNTVLMPAFNTAEGKRLYDESLARVRESFPQYVQELEGIAKGAGVDFIRLFLLHLGDLLTNYVAMAGSKEGAPAAQTEEDKTEPQPEGSEPGQQEQPAADPEASVGCLNIVVNNYHNRYIAHTQDATLEYVNHLYVVVAHIVNEEPQGKYKVSEEGFTSLCYAGLLPGFAMASNHHGIVFAVNKLSPCTVAVGKTPPHFLGRALLSAKCIEEAVAILDDEGVGAADGFSLSIASINDRLRKCYIMEVAPAIIGATHSEVNIGEVQSGSFAYHGNKYMGLEVNETSNIFTQKTDERLEAIANYDTPRTKERLLTIMNDENLFLIGDADKQTIRTIALGVFDLIERSFALYVNPPDEKDPLFVMPLVMKSNCRTFTC